MTTHDTKLLLNTAQNWVQLDPNPTTSVYVQSLIDQVSTPTDENLTSTALAELRSLFPLDGSRIEFGTAGLRAAMKPGPLGMNDLVILQTTQGLATYVIQQNKEHITNNKKKLLAVVGYDHRSYSDLQISSKSLATLTRDVFQQAGMECILFHDFIPTPFIAFATRYLQAAVGVMVTASHNPKRDNGFKVYWSDGCQIRPPLDQGIQQCILQNLNPWVPYKMNQLQDDYDDEGASVDRITTKELANTYYQALSQSGLSTGIGRNLDASCPIPKIVYTAMHGVGYTWAKRAMDTFLLPPFLSVTDQQQPDPTFSTVSFPNPEEKGALNLAFKYASECDAAIVIANDPDADRLAVAERNMNLVDSWITFTGDQIGTMLGHWLWDQIGKTSTKPVAMCASTASSKMLATIAKVEGFHFQDTLTGFKWIGHCANQLRQNGYQCLFAYEEAIGFCCGDIVSDKDGLSALGVMSELVYHVYQQGKTLAHYMQSLYDKYGEFCCNNGYFFCHDPNKVIQIFDSIRKGGTYMKFVGSYEIDSIRDLGFPGYDSDTEDKKPILPISKSSPMITIRFKNGCVVQFRASGTEPKFKYYIEMCGKPGETRENVQKELHEMSNIILELLLRPEENGLIKP